jgi:hypothetical protein
MNLKVRGCFCYFMRMPTLMTEFPFLEMIHVRKGTTGGAPDNKVHGKFVLRAIFLNIYRHFVWQDFIIHFIQQVEWCMLQKSPDKKRNSYIVR